MVPTSPTAQQCIGMDFAELVQEMPHSEFAVPEA
jgi:hypothetical protein